jgi:1,2-phenylacetyl-CoA epoxidase PaaB subunit
MANYCEYKVIVKGKKNACYAFFGSMSCADDKQIVEESGTDDNYVARFEGCCNWAVDAYCTPWEGKFPVELPENAEDAYQEGEDKYWYNTVRERSKMFEVEVLCNSADVEDYDPRYGPDAYFEHYINGEDAGGECPEELEIECYDGYYDEDFDDEDYDDDEEEDCEEDEE